MPIDTPAFITLPLLMPLLIIAIVILFLLFISLRNTDCHCKRRQRPPFIFASQLQPGSAITLLS